MYVKLYTLMVFMSLFIVACGGGGGGDTDYVGENTDPQSEGMVELAPVKGATVSIQALDGYTLATSTTQDDGFFR